MVVDRKSQRIIASSSSLSQVTDTLEATTFFTHKSGNKGKGVYMGTGSFGTGYSLENINPVGGYEGRSPTSNYRNIAQKKPSVICEFCGYNSHTRE